MLCELHGRHLYGVDHHQFLDANVCVLLIYLLISTSDDRPSQPRVLRGGSIPPIEPYRTASLTMGATFEPRSSIERSTFS